MFENRSMYQKELVRLKDISVVAKSLMNESNKYL